MAYLTTDAARRASRAIRSPITASAELKHQAGSPLATDFDIFLSHAFEDAEVVRGVRLLLEAEGFSVYVDWIEDAATDRSRVTAETADMLRSRMNHCRFLLFATSNASRDSKWMPWELGYFDGKAHGGVGILPLVAKVGDEFRGQEYLALYPYYESVNLLNVGRRFARKLSAGKFRRLEHDFARPL